jgi:hypothetical protein
MRSPNRLGAPDEQQPSARRRQQRPGAALSRHKYGNPGEDDAVVIWVITPPTF